MKKLLFIAIASLALTGCTEEPLEDNVIPTVDEVITWSEWSPSLSDWNPEDNEAHRVNFFQSREASDGTVERREVQVSYEESVSTHEEINDAIDRNADGDYIDLISHITRRYSTNLGGQVDHSFVLTEDRAFIEHEADFDFQGEVKRLNEWFDYRIYRLNRDAGTIFFKVEESSVPHLFESGDIIYMLKGTGEEPHVSKDRYSVRYFGDSGSDDTIVSWGSEGDVGVFFIGKEVGGKIVHDRVVSIAYNAYGAIQYSYSRDLLNVNHDLSYGNAASVWGGISVNRSYTIPYTYGNTTEDDVELIFEITNPANHAFAYYILQREVVNNLGEISWENVGSNYHIYSYSDNIVFDYHWRDNGQTRISKQFLNENKFRIRIFPRLQGWGEPYYIPIEIE